MSIIFYDSCTWSSGTFIWASSSRILTTRSLSHTASPLGFSCIFWPFNGNESSNWVIFQDYWVGVKPYSALKYWRSWPHTPLTSFTCFCSPEHLIRKIYLLIFKMSSLSFLFWLKQYDWGFCLDKEENIF